MIQTYVFTRGNEMSDYRGLSLPTVKALKDLDREMGQESAAPAPSGNNWAVGTPLKPGQTMRHPRTGEPMTPEEAEALTRALRQRQVPRAR